MFVELRFKTIDVNKKTIKQSGSHTFVFVISYHPVFLPFFRSPGTLYAPQVTFRPYLTGKGEGGGEKIFPLIKAVGIMLSNLQSNLSTLSADSSITQRRAFCF